MSPSLKKALLTAAAVLSGGANVIPGMNPVVGLALSALAGFLLGWARMKQPGQP